MSYKEMIESEEKFLDALKDAFRIRDHYFPSDVQKYPAYLYVDGRAAPYDINVNGGSYGCDTKEST